MAKTTLSVYLPEDLVAGVRGEAEQRDLSISDLVENLLRSAITQYRANKRVLREVTILQDLPRSLVNVPHDHPVFSRGKSGNGPFHVTVSVTS